MSRRRYLEKFTSPDGSTFSYTFPAYRYEWDSSQSLRSPRKAISGAHYAQRMLGNGPALKDVAQERVRCVLLGTADEMDDAADDVRAKLYQSAFGKVWTLGDDGTRRWAWSEVASMPDIDISYRSPLITPLVVGFNRFSDWYSDTLTISSATLGSNPTINNPGTAPVYNAILTIGGTFTDPILTNTSLLIPNSGLNYRIATLRDGSSANHRVKFDAGVDSVEYTSNGGSNWADDYANFVRQAGQVQLMVLGPGNNVFSRAGTVSASTTLYWSFYAAYH